MNRLHSAVRRCLPVLAVVALSGLLAACGSSSGSGSSPTSTASASGAAGFAARRTALAACLKQHGVSLPSRFRRPPGSGTADGGPPAGGAPGAGTPGGGPPAGARPGFFGGRGLGGRRPSAKVQAAVKACGANLGARGGRLRRLSRTAITAFVTCVRRHGYNLPAPNFSGNGPTFPSSIRTNPKFQIASRACASLLAPPPSPLPQTTSTTPTSS